MAIHGAMTSSQTPTDMIAALSLEDESEYFIQNYGWYPAFFHEEASFPAEKPEIPMTLYGGKHRAQGQSLTLLVDTALKFYVWSDYPTQLVAILKYEG